MKTPKSNTHSPQIRIAMRSGEAEGSSVVDVVAVTQFGVCVRA